MIGVIQFSTAVGFRLSRGAPSPSLKQPLEIFAGDGRSCDEMTFLSEFSWQDDLP